MFSVQTADQDKYLKPRIGIGVKNVSCLLHSYPALGSKEWNYRWKFSGHSFGVGHRRFRFFKQRNFAGCRKNVSDAGLEHSGLNYRNFIQILTV